MRQKKSKEGCLFFCLNIYIYWDFVCLLRKNSLVMESLASLLKEKGEASRVVFITGAGLSVASGIPTYRGGKDATWSNFVYKWGTREKFLKDPLEWYNTFWLATHHKKSYLTAKPNVGHRTVALLARRFKGVRVITQNIDGLHLRGKHYVPDEQLVEVHGHRRLQTLVGLHPPPARLATRVGGAGAPPLFNGPDPRVQRNVREAVHRAPH